MTPGLFDSGVLGTPQQRQENVIRRALEQRRDNWTHSGFFYRGGGDLLLQHGRFWSGRELPQQYEALKGVPGECFANAAQAVKADPSLRYVEGVYTVGQGHYTPHAWCIDPSGELVEVTYPTDPEQRKEAREYTTGLPVMEPEHYGYWGVILNPAYCEALWELQDGVGVLDRPTQDAREGHAEWRLFWDVLTHPYDAARATPYTAEPCPTCGNAHLPKMGCRECKTGAFEEPAGEVLGECPKCGEGLEEGNHCEACGWTRGEGAQP